MKIVEDNSTLVVNGLSPVDEEIDNIDDDYLEAKTKPKISLINDRRSFYDNHKWTNEDENGSHTSINGSKKPTDQISSSPKIYKSERSINLNSHKHERDEFDDLVDLTHRVPRKLLKKEANSNECLPQTVKNTGSAAAGRKYSSANKLSSSLPPLPPLPYSFVKLERSRAALSNPGSASSLHNYQPPSNGKSASSTPQHQPSNFNNQHSHSTTRLIIPINKEYNLNHPNGVLKENSNLMRTSSGGYVMTTPIHINGGVAQDEIDIIIYDSGSDIESCPSRAKENGNHHHHHFHRTYVTRHDVLARGGSPKPVNVMNEVDRINIVVNGQNLTASQPPNPKPVSTGSYVSAINNTINRLKMENRQPNSQQQRPPDMNREWDQISKIFASLETLLNEVVESTSKNSTPSCSSESTDSKTTITSQRTITRPSPPTSIKSPNSDPAADSTFTRRARNLLSTASSASGQTEQTDIPSTKKTISQTTNVGNLQISSSINNRKHLKHVQVGEFLKKIGLTRYELKFISNGYDDIYFLNDVITLQDLLQMGVEDYNDIFSVLSEVKKLPSSLKKIYDSRMRFGDVAKWLTYLNLNEYAEKFLKNNISTMERVKKLWEIELISLVQIPLLGHRRRIMNSVEMMIKLDRDKLVDERINSKVDSELEPENGDTSETERENEEEQQITCSSSSPNLTKKLLNVNSLLSTNNTSHNNSKTSSSSNDETSSSQSQAQTSSGSQVNLINSSSHQPQQRRNCLSCRSTFSSNSSATVTPSSFSKSVKFNDKEASKQANKPINNSSHSSLVHQSNQIESEDQLSNSFLISELISKHQKPKKKFDFHLSRFRKRESSSSQKSSKALSAVKSSGISSCSSGGGGSRSGDEDSYFGGSRVGDTASSVCDDDYRCPPKPIWKNDPQNLIKGSYNFIVYYLGSSAIPKNKSTQDPVKSTIDRLKNTSKSTPYQSPKVELSVSINGVKLLHYKTKEELCNYDIKHINNVCQDQDDLNYFAFSTQTEPGAHYYCHVFSCKDSELSTQIILTIGQAFDIAYEIFCKNNFS